MLRTSSRTEVLLFALRLTQFALANLLGHYRFCEQEQDNCPCNRIRDQENLAFMRYSFALLLIRLTERDTQTLFLALP